MHGHMNVKFLLISLPQKKRLVSHVAQSVMRLSYGMNRLKIRMRLPAGENLVMNLVRHLGLIETSYMG